MTRPLSSLQTVRGFVRDRRAMGAVEFAMVAPFLLFLYLGGSQLSMALTINRKVQHITSTINDLVTQSSSLKQADVAGIFNIANAMIIPYDMSPLTMRVTSVKIDSKGVQTVDWDYATPNLTGIGKGSRYALPADFANLRDRYVVVTQTDYTFTPVAGYFATGSIPMGGTSYLDPRNSDKVSCDDCK